MEGKRVSYDRLGRWRSAVFDGDLDRGLIPRESSHMTVPPEKRTGLERQRARERAAHEAEVARLKARVQELEQTESSRVHGRLSPSGFGDVAGCDGWCVGLFVFCWGTWPISP